MIRFFFIVDAIIIMLMIIIRAWKNWVHACICVSVAYGKALENLCEKTCMRILWFLFQNSYDSFSKILKGFLWKSFILLKLLLHFICVDLGGMCVHLMFVSKWCFKWDNGPFSEYFTQSCLSKEVFSHIAWAIYCLPLGYWISCIICVIL